MEYESTSVSYESVEEVPESAESKNGWANKISRWAFYLFIFLTPVFYLSYTLPVWFGKQIFVFIIVGIAFIAWLADFLTIGVLSYRKTIINPLLLVFLSVLAFSTYYSQSIRESLWGFDPTGEKFASMAIFALVYFLAGSIFREKDDIRVGISFFAGSALVGLLTLLQMLGFRFFPGSYDQAIDFNPVGTLNALSMFYGMILAAGIGVVAHFREFRGHLNSKIFLILASASSFILFLNVFLVVNFRLVWFALAASMLVLVSLGVKGVGRGEGGGNYSSAVKKLGGLSFYLPLIILAASVLFYVSSFNRGFSDSLTGGPNSATRWSARFPAEVSPSYSATMSIGKNVLKTSKWLGSGPGTFIYDYNLYRDPVLNLDRIFWAVKFFHGSALIPTMVSTTGILGVSAAMLFVLAVFCVVLKSVLLSSKKDPFRFGIASAIVFGIISWFVYPPTFTLSLFLFILLGVFASLSREDEGGILALDKRMVGVRSAYGMFAGSLVAIFLIVASVVGIYYSFQKYLAEKYYTEGLAVINQPVSDEVIEKALNLFGSAASVDPYDDRYLRLQGQVYLVKLNNTIQKQVANPNQNLVQEFNVNFVSAFNSLKRAQELNPSDAQNWKVLGLVCESVLALGNCSEKFLTETYEAAIPRDPISPTVRYDAGKAWVLTSDILSFRIQQSKSAEEIKALLQQQSEALNKALDHLEKAAELKPDYSQAHFLSAQTYVRQNNLKGAIRKLEDTRAVALGDVGVRFQLGFLYYQAGQMDNAELEFATAVGLNENYSNARYFLGLIYDRKGGKAAALDQFRRIEALNPDNQEIKLIIKNLEEGKAALAGIVPPNPPPEKRSEPPVPDTGKK